MENSLPFISVIIPTYERVSQLSVCLGALAAQGYPRDRFEVLVVDDGSTTSPEASVEAFRQQLNVRFLKQLHSGPAAARNYGAAYAKYSFLAFTDDDCAPTPSWLQSLATCFVSCSDCVLGGRTINELANNPYSTVSQLVVDYLYARWNPDPMHATFFTSNNLALPAKCFQAVGGFDTGWTRAAGEDRDLCDRLIARGYRLIYTPDALVRHAHPLTFQTFWRQHFNYGRGAYRLHQLRARRDARGICVEPLAFYLRMLGYPFVRTRGREGACMAALLAIAQAANAAGWIVAFLDYSTKMSPR
jgi:GT2 family glycosyltransferase